MVGQQAQPAQGSAPPSPAVWGLVMAAGNVACLVAVVYLEPAGFDLCDALASPAARRAQWAAVASFAVVMTGVAWWVSSDRRLVRLSTVVVNVALWIGLLTFLTSGQSC